MTGVAHQWWRAVAITLIASTACVLLGMWQLDRREQRLTRIEQVALTYDRAPVPLADVLPSPASPLPASAEFTPVSLTGTYLPQQTLLVRNRPLGGVYGYLVLVPLRLDAAAGGGSLLVDRGWVRPGADGSGPAAVPPPPPGRVSVVARLRPPEPGDGRSAPAGQVTRVDLGGSVAAALDDASVRTAAYGQLVSEQPELADRPTTPPRPEADEGPHLGYSLQWFVFAAGMWAFLAVHVRRSLRDPLAPASTSRPDRRPTRRPVSDEDAEDAVLDGVQQSTDVRQSAVSR